MELVVIATITFLLGFLLGRLPSGADTPAQLTPLPGPAWELLRYLPEDEREAIVRRYFSQPDGVIVLDGDAHWTPLTRKN